MIWILLCTLSSASIFVIFKLIDRDKINVLNSIVINYFVASVFGFLVNRNFNIPAITSANWFLAGVFIGILFIVMFFVIGLSSAKVGISITTVASKMSVIIPILFAILAYSEPVGWLKIIAITIAIVAVLLTIYKRNVSNEKIQLSYFFIPVILFIGMGLVDSLVIYSKETYVDENTSALFTASLFGISFLSGVLFSLIKPESLKFYKNFRVWIYGVALGIVNFGSIYLMLRALNSGIFNNSIIYGIVNIGIVTLSVLVGKIVFKEKLSKTNYIGISMSILAIILLSFAEQF